MKSARQASLIALLSFFREGTYLLHSLETWQRESLPSKNDFSFAIELSYGTLRYVKLLRAYTDTLCNGRRLKQKERLILSICLYQRYFMEKVPQYAISSTGVELAKKYTHLTFAKFLNQLLRKLPENLESLKLKTPNDFATKYSYPEFFVESCLKAYGENNTCNLLNAMNHKPQLTARVRSKSETLNLIQEKPFPFIKVEDIESIKNDSNYYIQNITQATLIHSATKLLEDPPKQILDMCAAPGGKSILLSDIFPESAITSLESSSKRISILKENIEKYSLKLDVIEGDAKNFTGNTLFDLIVCDLPCSNTGVLAKRPEARWRLDKTNLTLLFEEQTTILKNAYSLLAKDATLVVTTCSIYPDELELIEKTLESLQNTSDQITKKIIFPDSTLLEGGSFHLLKKL